MNLLETMCAMMVFAIMGSSALYVWQSTLKMLHVATAQYTAGDDAVREAERFIAGDTDGAGQSMPYQVTQRDINSDNGHFQVINVLYEGQNVTLWIPK